MRGYPKHYSGSHWLDLTTERDWQHVDLRATVGLGRHHSQKCACRVVPPVAEPAAVTGALVGYITLET